jgi:hypothetical protein
MRRAVATLRIAETRRPPAVSASSVARSAAYVAHASSTSRASQSSASGAGVEPLAARGAGSVLQRIARLASSRAPWFSSAEEATVSPSSLATASRTPSSAARPPAPCSSVSAFCANSRSNTHAPLGLRGAPFRVERSEPVLTWRRRADPHAAGVVAAPEPRRVHDLHPADHPVADVTAEHDGARAVEHHEPGRRADVQREALVGLGDRRRPGRRRRCLAVDRLESDRGVGERPTGIVRDLDRGTRRRGTRIGAQRGSEQADGERPRRDGARGASPRTRDGRRGKGRGRGDGGRPHRAPAGWPPGACRSDPDVRDARLEVVLRP